MYNVTAIVPRGQGSGFVLSGIQVREVSNITEAQNILTLELEEVLNGVILIDESFIHELPSKLQKQVDESTIPLVVSVPIITKWEPISDRKEIINNIIRRAIGYRIKLTGE